MKKNIINLIIFLAVQVYSQTFHVSGNISTDAAPVKYASVIFTEKGNPSHTFTTLTDIDGNYQFDIITSVRGEPVLPRTIELAQNYPNPFSSETEIQYKINKQASVSIKIYDVLGQEVKVINKGLQTNGVYEARWDGRNNYGDKVCPGIYFYQLYTGAEAIVKKMIFVNSSSNTGISSINNLSFNNTHEIKKEGTQGTEYFVKIDNSDSTYPRIKTQEYYDLLIQSDTTLSFTVEEEQIDNGLMVVYSNSGKKLTIIDCNTFEAVKNITVDVPDSLYITRMCLSTNKEYFIFIASITVGRYPTYIITYNIEEGIVSSIFPIGLDTVGAPRLTAAYIQDKPGLLYLYTHNHGLYSIDFNKEEVNLISDECDQSLGKFFYFTGDKKTCVILKKFGSKSYDEIEFYNTLSELKEIQFVLNQNNKDSISIDDLIFSKDNKIFISIRLPQTKWIENYFGSYDLETKELRKANFTLPWSINAYLLGYSPGRNEIYTVGAQDKLFVIDVSTDDYFIKDVIEIPGKVDECTSKIFIRRDEKIAFISCSFSNLVFVIDLDTKQVIKKINIEFPYLMLQL
jgi:hypothetical protein